MMRLLNGALFAMLAVGVATRPLEAQKKVSAGHAATSTVSVRLFAAVGTVSVVGWDRDSVDVSGNIATGSRFEFSSPPGIARGMKMFVEAATEKAGLGGTLTLRVPRGAQIWVKTGTADVSIADITGGVDVNVVGGSVTVRGAPRELRAESMDGSVIIDGAPEWLRVKTATGNITLHGGQNVGASTISGTIDASGGVVDRAKFETTTGAIRYSLALARGASVELETHSGQIDLQFARKAEVEVDAATITGAIENLWNRVAPVAGREGRGMTLTTSSGMSAGRVVVRSFRGRIALRGM